MESKAKTSRYTPGEEIASSVTHGVGAALGVAALAVLVTMAALRGDPWKVVSFSIYGVSLTLLYSASTLYHAVRGERLKKIFRCLDHASIYLLIAGSYTPFTLVTLRGGWGWTLFGLVWVLALAGIALTAMAAGRSGSSKLTRVLLYVGMGWLVVVAIRPLVAAIPAAGMALLVAGGLFYTGGVVFYVARRLPFNHAIWHGFVLAGSICHFAAVYLYVLPA